MTAVTVIIPTYGRADMIGRSVRAVLANDHPSFEVVVVDQSPDDATGAVVRSIAEGDARVRYVHTSPPGLSRAYNIGADLATAPVLAFTDDDCVASPRWVSAIERAFAAEPDADMLYGEVARARSIPEEAGEVPKLLIAEPMRIDPRNGFRLYGMGANFALRRNFLKRIGGFDEILGGGGPLRSSQDFDLQYRAYLSGAVVLLRPEVSVDHYGLRNPSEWSRTLRAYGIGDAAFYLKHVRCGDGRAARLLVNRVARLMARHARHLMDRRRPSQAAYLRAYLEGAVQSFGYPIDRHRRLYRPRAAGRAM